LAPPDSFFRTVKKFLLKNLNLRNALGFGISGVLLWLTFYNSGLKVKDLGFSTTDFLYFVLADVLFIVSIGACAARIKLFVISDYKKAADVSSLESVIIGNFYNCLLPGNLGEGMRAWHFSKKNKIPFLQSMSLSLAEKWIDAQYFVFLTIGLFTFRSFMPHYVSYSILYMALAVVGLSCLYIFMRYHKKTESTLLSLVLLFKKPGKIVFKLYWYTSLSIRDMIRKRLMLKYTFFCAIVYTLNALQFYFLMKSAGVREPVTSLYTSYLIALSMMIIAFIPSAPSNIGVLHYGMYSVLIFSAIQQGITPGAQDLQSFARFAVYVHLSYLLPEILMGILCVIKERKLVFGLSLYPMADNEGAA
jgi:uncharacterized protein (TIRG00374 family)